MQPLRREPVESSAGHPWSEVLLREHLRFFNSSEAGGRGTGTSGYALAAAYVAARMKQFGLQPALHADYRISYSTPLNTAHDGRLFAGGDTLRFVPGLDFIPDARSDSGEVIFRRAALVGRSADVPRAIAGAPEVIIAPSNVVTQDLMDEARARGHRAVISVGPLRPMPAARPVSGLVAIQVSPEASEELLGQAISQAISEGGPRRSVILPQEIRVMVSNEFREQAGAVNVLGYIAGRRPKLRNEMVLVCADLDAVGNAAGVQAIDLRHFGISASALLEVARELGLLARFEPVPQKTLLFAVFSGARLNDAGLRAYLDAPLWPLDQTAAVVYVGLNAEREINVRNLLAPYGIPIVAIPPSDVPLHESDLVLLPRSSDRRGPDGRSQSASVTANLSRIIDEAASRARERAEETHEILFNLGALE